MVKFHYILYVQNLYIDRCAGSLQKSGLDSVMQGSIGGGNKVKRSFIDLFLHSAWKA